MEYYSALERNGVLTHTTPRIDLEDTMLQKINQLQKDTYSMISLTFSLTLRRIGKFIATENKMKVARRWRRREWAIA